MKNNQDHWTKEYLEALNKKIAQSKTAVKNTPIQSAEQPKDGNQKKNHHKKHKNHKFPKSHGGQQVKKAESQNQDSRKGRETAIAPKPVKTQANPHQPKPGKMNRARVIGGTITHTDSQFYYVLCGNQEYPCKARFQNLNVKELYVGDHVHIIPETNGPGWIEKMDPRQNQVVNPLQKNQKQETVVAVNINQVVIVVSAKEPVIRTDWIDRHLVVFERRGFKPVICCTKIDLAEDNAFIEQLDLYRRLGYRLMFVSSLIPSSVNELKLLFKNKKTLIAGHTGVGKTTLIQLLIRKQDRTLTFDKDHFEWLMTDDYTETNEVRAYRLDIGGMLIDTPGIREYEIAEIPGKDLKKYFREFRNVNAQCSEPNCNHVDEPLCAIRQGVSENLISQDRYDSYLKIMESLS